VTAGGSAAGEAFLAEIHEQPAALARLLARPEAEEVARALTARRPRLVRLAAHGTSDNAAVFGVYAFALLAGWTALRDSISLSVYYEAELDVADSAVVALSQSGQTPDVVEYVERARSRGALTIALTNEEGSELARAAELVVPLAAGPERAVAATKTYVNELAALALLAGQAGGRGGEVAEGLAACCALLEQAVADLEPAVGQAAVPFAFVGRMFVIGRGAELATAREIALKLSETCRVVAEPLTATDFAHGPIAVVDPLFPVWVIASHDPALPVARAAAEAARAAGATVIASGCAAGEIDGAAWRFATPEPPLELLGPILSVVPGQLFAWALARARGLDPDAPAGLSKVTLAP
jgi:glucosamine--fructose-6-phosphate aminotransferase (isomerizing)